MTAVTERGTGGGTPRLTKDGAESPETDPCGHHGQLTLTKQQGPFSGKGESLQQVGLEQVATRLENVDTTVPLSARATESESTGKIESGDVSRRRRRRPRQLRLVTFSRGTPVGRSVRAGAGDLSFAETQVPAVLSMMESTRRQGTGPGGHSQKAHAIGTGNHNIQRALKTQQ